jgi:hypothetical protein
MIRHVIVEVPEIHPRGYQTETLFVCDSDKGKNIVMLHMAPNSPFFEEQLIDST